METSPPRDTSRRQARLAPYLVLAAMLLLTAFAARSVRQSERAQDRLRFENAVQRTSDDINARLAAYVSALRAGTAMFASHGEVSREEFETFVRRLDLGRHYPGVQGFGYARRAGAKERESLAAAARREGLADFRVWPEGEREEYFPILLLEPRDERNRAALGYDMFAEPVRREAMERARDTALPAATGRVTLVQEIDESGRQAGFLIYFPVYRGGVEPETIEARRAALIGFVYSPFRADDLLRGIFGAEPNPLVDFEVYDGKGAAPESLLHRSAAARGAPAGPEPLLAETRSLEVGGRPWAVRFFARPDADLGAGGWLAALVGACGAALAFLLFFVTRAQVRARAEAEEAAASLRASETRFRTVVDQSPVSIQIFAPDGRTVRVNRAWEELWGTTREQLGDYNVLKDPQLEVKGVAPYVRRGFAGEVVEIPTILYDPEETIPGLSANADPRRHVSAIIYPVKDEGGRVREVVLMHEDVTARVEAEGERDLLLERERTLRAEAEAANRLKDEFLATLSHELRTPLTSVLGWAKLLRTKDLDPQTAERAHEAVERNAEVLARLVNDLLDVSRIVTGKLRLNVRPVSLSEVIEAAAEGVRPAAAARGVRLDVRLDPRAGEVAGDPDRLQQVVWNLLTNAVKFTPAGGRVEVGLARRDGLAEVKVSDTGQGIAPEFLPYVFDRFRQQDGAITREHGGLGLGLAIARHLVELHGGTVAAESEGVGRGASFTVTLPALAAAEAAGAGAGADGDGRRGEPGESDGRRGPQAEGPPRRPRADAPLAGLNILVVEDDEDSLNFLSEVLEGAGARVTRALSAAEGFEKLKLLRPDALVSDIGMPGEDGYGLIARVRALAPEEGGRTPAVALTAYARAEDRARALEAGYQQHLSKPIEPSALVGEVARLAARAASAL